MEIFAFFREFLYFEAFERVAAVGMVVLAALCVVLRGVLHGAYRAAIALISHSAKAVKTKGDIAKLGAGAFGRAARDFVALAEAGTKVDAMELARASISKNKLLLFNFSSIGSFVLAVEAAFLPLAILFTLAAPHTMAFALICATIFIVMRVFAAIFDIAAIRERYEAILGHTLAKHVGRFFPEDATAAIYTFGKDLNEYLTRQSAMYSDLLIRINSEFANSLKSNVAAMTTGVEATLAAISRQEGLEGAIYEWRTAVSEAKTLQNDSANSIIEMSLAAEKLTKTLGEAARLINNSENMEKRNEALENSLSMTKENQAMLAVSVAQYEASLKEITAQLGDALGKIVGYHLSAANAQIADNISANLKASNAANLEHISEIKAIFAQLNEQSRATSRLLMALLKGDRGEAASPMNKM
jgi:hypothetical protein